MTRGRCSSLRLHRDGLAPSTFRRSPGAPVHHIKPGLPPWRAHVRFCQVQTWSARASVGQAISFCFRCPRGPAGEAIPGIHPGRFPDRAPLRRDGARPCPLAQARTHDGWRRYGDERARQGFGLYGALAGRRGHLEFVNLARHRVPSHSARALAASERLSASVRFRAVTGRPSRQLPRLGCAISGHSAGGQTAAALHKALSSAGMPARSP